MEIYSNSNIPNNNRRRRALFLLITVFVIVILYLLLSFGKNERLPKVGSKPSSDVQKIINMYLGAREDRAGTDQASPTSWLDQIKTISTSTFLNSIKPKGESTTSVAPYNYTYAHDNKYIVKAGVSDCKWSGEGLKPTSVDGVVHGVIICNLSDTTVEQSTGNAVSANSLQFGWPYNGRQQSPILSLSKQNGVWLIDGDATGNFQ